MITAFIALNALFAGLNASVALVAAHDGRGQQSVINGAVACFNAGMCLVLMSAVIA